MDLVTVKPKPGGVGLRDDSEAQGPLAITSDIWTKQPLAVPSIFAA